MTSRKDDLVRKRRMSEEAQRWRALGLVMIGFVTFFRLLNGFRLHTLDDVGPQVVLRIDPNVASLPILDALPRLGTVLSGRIIEAREIRPFRDLQDLDDRVRGIGPATLGAIRPYLRLPDRD